MSLIFCAEHADEEKETSTEGITSQKNFRFGDMVTLVEAFGFRLARSSGSHHIFIHPEVTELVNLQEVQGQAKPYQIQPVSPTGREV